MMLEKSRFLGYPGFYYPEGQKKDEQGNFFISMIVLWEEIICKIYFKFQIFKSSQGSWNH